MKDTPPADLLACARRDAALPTDQAAQIPAPLRTGLIALAAEIGSNADQLDRLINWIAPATCAAP